MRAAAEDAKAAKAATAEAEAAWAAAGVGSGGGGGDNAMLFLECEVNGRPLRAFVDTGAQVSPILPMKRAPDRFPMHYAQISICFFCVCVLRK